MERTQIFDLMSELKLFGMRSAYDDVMTAGIKRQHSHEQPRTGRAASRAIDIFAHN
jgi:hypothetical protein